MFVRSRMRKPPTLADNKLPGLGAEVPGVKFGIITSSTNTNTVLAKRLNGKYLTECIFEHPIPQGNILSHAFYLHLPNLAADQEVCALTVLFCHLQCKFSFCRAYFSHLSMPLIVVIMHIARIFMALKTLLNFRLLFTSIHKI